MTITVKAEFIREISTEILPDEENKYFEDIAHKINRRFQSLKHKKPNSKN